jgi:DNA repair protein SbcD/Mre11
MQVMRHEKLRFLQFSDLHLDANLGCGKLRLPADKRAVLRRNMLHALERVVDLAHQDGVDVILLPGDLWDDESVSLETASQAYDVLGSAAPIPVLIAPGNHDPYHGFSFHNPDYFRMKTGRSHPDNVHVFSSLAISPIRLPQLEGVAFYGCCFRENRPRTDRMLQSFRPEQADELNILVLHGSQDDNLPYASVAESAGQPAQLLCAPFSARELIETGIDYTALGHYHRYSEIKDPRGQIRAAYGGIPVARGLDEIGEHFVLTGQISRGGVEPDSLDQITADVRQILRISVPVDPSVTSSFMLHERIRESFQKAGVSRDDIVFAVLEGYTHPEVAGFDVEPERFDTQCFHLVVDQSRLEPDLDLDSLLADETAARRIEGQFAKRMKELITNADPEQARILRAALYAGMDALQSRDIRPRHAH